MRIGVGGECEEEWEEGREQGGAGGFEWAVCGKLVAVGGKGREGKGLTYIGL